MKYPYIVNKDGVWYPAGTEVPEDSFHKSDVAKDDFSQYMNPPEEKKPYTKTEINRMPVAELRKVAMSTGVEGAEDMTGNELKEYLFNLFGL